ncbi:hypothetical protein DFJ73DRAFT_813059 [Zopfochytrium polystomum]|nr:hypothetical protein DFJ73DRAFT_813059 [Zopfochytrium polystomum]
MWRAPVFSSDAVATAIRDTIESSSASSPSALGSSSSALLSRTAPRPFPFDYAAYIAELYLEDLTASAVLSLLNRLLPHRKIRVLHVSGGQGAATALTHANLASLLSIPGLSFVKELRIGYLFDHLGEIGSVRAFDAAKDLNPFDGLEWIDLGSTRWVGDKSVMSMVRLLEGRSRLRSLDIGASFAALAGGLMDGRVTDSSVSTVVEKLGASVTNLSVAGVGLTESCLRAIGRHGRSILRYLNLAWCDGLTDDGLACIVESCTSLVGLDLAGTAGMGITDEGWKLLAANLAPRLEDLGLSECGVSDKMVIHIVGKAGRLLWLDISESQSTTSQSDFSNDLVVGLLASECARSLQVLIISRFSEYDSLKCSDAVVRLSTGMRRLDRVFHGLLELSAHRILQAATALDMDAIHQVLDRIEANVPLGSGWADALHIGRAVREWNAKRKPWLQPR